MALFVPRIPVPGHPLAFSRDPEISLIFGSQENRTIHPTGRWVLSHRVCLRAWDPNFMGWGRETEISRSLDLRVSGEHDHQLDESMDADL